MTELVALVDTEGTVLYASAAHEQKLGHPAEELIGGALLSLIHPNDLEQVGAAMADCAANGQAQISELRVRHRDGRWLVLDGRLTKVDAGNQELLLMIARDVIVEALAEARRRGLATIAFVGYDGGRIAAERLADHVVVTPSEHIPRIQEAQATGYHALRELVELGGAK